MATWRGSTSPSAAASSDDRLVEPTRLVEPNRLVEPVETVELVETQEVRPRTLGAGLLPSVRAAPCRRYGGQVDVSPPAARDRTWS